MDKTFLAQWLMPTCFHRRPWRPGMLLAGSWPPAAVRDDPKGLLLRSERRRRAPGISVLEKTEDDLRRVSYSKERRGFPLEIGCFAGNQAETTTILPIITAFQSATAWLAEQNSSKNA